MMTIQVVMDEKTNTTTSRSTKRMVAIKPLTTHFRYAKAAAYVKSASVSSFAEMRCGTYTSTITWYSQSTAAQTSSTSYVWVESPWVSITSSSIYGIGVQLRVSSTPNTAYIKHAAVVLSSKNF